MTPLGFVVIIKRTGIEGFRYPLQQATCLLGRGAECDIRIQLPVVSKQQCKIEFDQQLKEAVLINLNSVNPTRLNGVTFARPTKLVHGDVITIVDRSFRFEYGSGSAGENTPIKPSEPKSKEVTPTQSRSSSISTLISDQYQRRTVQVFKNIHAKYTEENISRQFSLLQSLEAKIIANKSKNQDASNNMGDHRPGKTPTLESKELKESATGSSEGDVSQVSTPEHPGKSKKNTNSPFKQLFGLMREELNSKCQQIGDHLNRKSEPIQVSMSGREWETELLHLPRSKPIRRSEVVRISQNWQEPQQKGQEAVAALSKEEGASKGSSSAKGAESAQTQEHKSPRAKRRKSQSLLTPVKTSGKRKSKTGSGKDKQKSVSGTCEGSPLQEAQSPQTLYTLRSQTKKPEASPLGNDKEAAMATKTTPAEKLVLKQSDPNGGSETTNLAQKKGSPKGNKSADTQLNPKRASNSDQILKKIQDELYFEGGGEAAQIASVSPDISQFDISDFEDSSSEMNNVSESEESSAKRRRVSFGVHLRPELFDENLPPNTPLKRGETPGLRRTSLGRTVLRKSIIKLTSEKEASSSAGHLEPKASLDQLSPKPTTTAPKEARSPSCLPTTKAKSTPVVGSQPRKTSRRSSSGRRSQHEALQTIFAKRRSGASEANLMVVQSWADVVKLGTKKSQGEVVVKHGLERRRIKKQKRCLTPKKPANQAQNHFSTGHANSPCTIVIGKAHTEKVMAPAQPYRVFNNLVLNSKVDMNEDLTGLDEMFRTPMSEKQKTANVCPESPTPQLLSGEKAKLAHTSSDEALVSTSDKLAEKVISNTQDKAKQTSGQIIPCRRSPRNRHSMGDDEIIKTPKEISEIRGDEIMETLPPEVDVDHKKLTPSTKRLKTCTPKEVGPTPYLNRNSESAAQGEGALVEDHPKTPVASRVSKFEDRFPGTPNIEEKVKENSANNLKNQKPKMVPQVGITASFKIKEPFVIDIQKHTRTSLQKQYSSSDAQGTVAITSQQHELSSMKKPERTPKEKGPIEDLTGIRELMTTPIPTEDRIDEKLRISKQVCSAIDADIQKKPMAIKQQMETEDVGSIKEFIKTPKRKCEPVEPLTAVKRLMRTPKDKVEPREDKVSYERLMKTPKEKEPVESQKNNQNVNVRQMPKTAKDPGGLRRCVDTPKEKIARDLTDLMTTPKQVVEPVKDQVSKTTMMKPEQKVESVENLTEIKVLIKTPKEKEELVEDRKESGKKLTMRSSKEKREVVEDSVGIKKIKKTKASEQVEDVTGLGKPSRTSKEKKKIGENLALKKLMRIRKGKIKLVEDLTGLKKLQTPEEKGEPDEDLTGIKRLMQTPNEKGEPDEDLTGIKRLMQTPNEKGEPDEDLTGIKRLMQTPKEKGDPVEDLTGIKRLMRTPKQKGGSVEDLTCIKKLMRTPKEKGGPVEDLTGIKRLMQTPKEKGGSVEDLTGIKRLMQTPKEKGGSVEDLTGIKRLMQTPKQKGGSVEDLTGIKRLMQTPKEKGGSVEDLTGIKRLMRTPKQKGGSVEDLTGIKRLMRTPKQKGEPVEDLTGIKRLMQTPKEKGGSVEDLTGIKRLMQTPKQKGGSVEDLTGIKRLMQTPKEKGGSVEDLTGIKRLMQTPKEKGDPVEDLTGIKRLMQTPKEKGGSVEDLTGIKRLMQTPKEKGEIEKNFTNVAVFMETSKNNISSTHTLRQNYPKEITDRDSVVSEILYEIETLRRPAIKDVSVSNQESQTIEKTPELLPEVPTRVVRGVIASKSLKPPRKNKLVGEEDICRANPKSKESSSEVNCDYNESKDKSVEQCQRQICFNPCESDYISETERDLSNVTNDIFPEKEKEKFLPHIQDKVKGIIENQRTITLRSRSKIKSGKEPEGSVHLLRSTRVHLKNSEKTVKTPWEENVKEKVEQSSSLTQSSEVKPSEEEKKETLEDLRGKSGDMSGNMERMAPFQPRRNQASKETQSSSLSDMSDLENSENNSPRKNLRVRLKDAALNEGRASTLRSKKTNKDSPCESDVSYTDDEMKLGKRLPRKPNVPPRFSSRNKTTKELQETGPLGSEIETLSSENGEERGIMGALRSRNRNKVDTEWQEPSSSLSDIISHTGRDEKKPMKVVLKEEKLKAQITSSGISLRSRKKNKEMLNFGDLAPDSDKTYTDEEKESVKSLPEKLKGQRILVESRNRNISVIEINEYDSLSSESPTKNEKYAGVNEDKVALRTRSRNKDKASEEKQESKTTDISCIENKGKKAKGLQAQWNTTFLRTKTRIEATKESQEPDSLPTEAGKPHTEDYEKPGEGKAFQDKSKNTDPSKGITKKKSKMDKESEGSIDSSRDTEINKPVKSFQENLINETMMSLRSQSKKKDTELSYLTKILSVENNEKMPRKNFPEKNILKESPVNEDKVPLRPRTVKSVAPEKLDPKDEKNPGKGQKNLNDTTGSGGMSLRSRNKSKMETVGLNENPVSTSEKDAEKSINTSSRMLKNSLIPQETLGRSRNKIGPQESCRLPSATEVVLVEEDDKKTLSQKNLGKKLNLRVGGLDPHKTRNRNKADQELYNNSLHNVTEMTDTEANQEKMEKILKDQIVTKDLVPRRPRLTNKNNKEVKESAGKDEKENVAQIFPNKGIDRTSLRTRLRNRSDTDLQKSANLNKKDSFNDAKTTTGKAPNGKQIDFAFLENKRGNSRIANIKEPTNSIQEGHFVKVGQVPDKAFKVILTSAKNTQSEPTLLRERSMLLKRSTSQTQKCNDTNSQERTLRFRRKCTLKQTEVLTTSSKQSNINPKLMKNIKA
uniref:Marker of proliferation Ki-67 n=1 Tax=Monodelphis domestica TaxID=13616 RepID=F6RFD6_MONDO